MQVASACVLHRAMTFDKNPETTFWTTIAIVTAIAVETAYHSIADEQIVHELLFLALIVLVSIKTRSLIKARVAAKEDRKVLMRLTIFGTGIDDQHPMLRRALLTLSLQGASSSATSSGSSTTFIARSSQR